MFLLYSTVMNGTQISYKSCISNLHTELEVCVGLARDAASLRQTTSELVALENIEKQDNRLKSDEVARKSGTMASFSPREIDRQKHGKLSETRFGTIQKEKLGPLMSELSTD